MERRIRRRRRWWWCCVINASSLSPSNVHLMSFYNIPLVLSFFMPLTITLSGISIFLISHIQPTEEGGGWKQDKKENKQTNK